MKYFSDNKYKYSTALMFAYINLCNHNKTKLNIDDLISTNIFLIKI